MLEKLPLEILQLIGNELPKRKDFVSLSTVSKNLNRAFIPLLYHEIIVAICPEDDLAHGKCAHNWAGTKEGRERLQYVRRIHFVADVHGQLTDRCPHYSIPKEQGGSAKDGQLLDAQHSKDLDLDPLERLDKEVMNVLLCIQPGSLIAFSWELGICVPKLVSKFIRGTQPNIQNISLITAWSCLSLSRNQVFSVDHGLKNLKTISWSGLSCKTDLSGLQRALQGNQDHLKSLNLDFNNWASLKFFVTDSSFSSGLHPESLNLDNFFARSVLQLGRRQREIKFPALQNLCFTQVSFRRATVELAWALNLRTLRSLTLRDCPGTARLLQVLSGVGDLELEKLEVVLNMDSDSDSLDPGAHNVGSILDKLPKLETLYLMTRQTDLFHDKFWNAMQSNMTTPLRNFVLHYRDEDIDFPEEEMDFARDVDLGDMEDNMAQFLSASKIERLGLYSTPESLQQIFYYAEPRPPVTFFHWRHPGTRPDPEDPWPSPCQTDVKSEFSDRDNFWDDQPDEAKDPTRTIANADVGNQEPTELPVENFNPHQLTNNPDISTMDELLESVGALVEDQLGSEESDDSEFEWQLEDDMLMANEDPIPTPMEFHRARGGLTQDYLDFIKWMFCEGGLPELEILVMGDMCHGGRYEAALRIFVRRTSLTNGPTPKDQFEGTNFYELDDDHPRFHEIIEEYREMLQACPAEKLFGRHGGQVPTREGYWHLPGRYAQQYKSHRTQLQP